MAKFLINDDVTTPQPHEMRHPARPEAGFAPLYVFPDGQVEIEISYQILSEGDYQKLVDFFYSLNDLPYYHWDPLLLDYGQWETIASDLPIVKLTYDDPYLGTEHTDYFAMSFPEGVHEGVWFYNVTVRFHQVVEYDQGPV